MLCFTKNCEEYTSTEIDDFDVVLFQIYWSIYMCQ